MRRILTTKHQLPDSFPYVIEKDFGDEVAVEFEQYVANSDQMNIENLDKTYNFQVGVDHMNQVVSFERIIYFGFIQERFRDQEASEHGTFKSTNVAFGSKFEPNSKIPKLPGIRSAAKGEGRVRSSYD